MQANFFTYNGYQICHIIMKEQGLSKKQASCLKKWGLPGCLEGFWAT